MASRSRKGSGDATTRLDGPASTYHLACRSLVSMAATMETISGSSVWFSGSLTLKPSMNEGKMPGEKKGN